MRLNELENYGFRTSHATAWDGDNCKTNFFFLCNGDLDQIVILHLSVMIYVLFNHQYEY